MARVIYILKDGTRQDVEVATGTSVMTAAIKNRIRGILAECGGTCSCATCHVYVDDAFTSLLPDVSESENEMLDGVAAERLPNSRLSCQIIIDDKLDGLIVTVPDRQG